MESIGPIVGCKYRAARVESVNRVNNFLSESSRSFVST